MEEQKQDEEVIRQQRGVDGEKTDKGLNEAHLKEVERRGLAIQNSEILREGQSMIESQATKSTIVAKMENNAINEGEHD